CSDTSPLLRNAGRRRQAWSMLHDINLPLILAAALMATGSPGPATLTIAGASMQSGRGFGLAVASGVSTGSLIWSVSAAFGLGTLMLANVWIFEIIRYCGAAYLLYLAFRSAKSALTPGDLEARSAAYASMKHAYARGLALHLTNPK